jgi:hypothetical protein
MNLLGAPFSVVLASVATVAVLVVAHAALVLTGLGG